MILIRDLVAFDTSLFIIEVHWGFVLLIQSIYLLVCALSIQQTLLFLLNFSGNLRVFHGDLRVISMSEVLGGDTGIGAAS